VRARPVAAGECESAARPVSKLRAAEFFAGMGLMRLGLEREGVEVVFANDIEPVKARLYSANFNSSHLVLGDVREVGGDDVPDIDLATASFPCTDLSVAGRRRGLAGGESAMFWELARVLGEMAGRRPRTVLLENVLGFASSRGGRDLRSAVGELNALGYSCDVLVGDAAWFVPQSRPRLFIVGSREATPQLGAPPPSPLRPERVVGFYRDNPDLRLHVYPLTPPEGEAVSLERVVERMGPTDRRWWDEGRTNRFAESLSEIQRSRLGGLASSRRLNRRTAYRRTRRGEAVWEIRSDDIAGCLRTARGGSSKQAVVEAGRGAYRLRWMTPLEYARLQGAGDLDLGSVTDNQALFALGDAVCVPVIRWIVRSYLKPLAAGAPSARAPAAGSVRQDFAHA